MYSCNKAIEWYEFIEYWPILWHFLGLNNLLQLYIIINVILSTNKRQHLLFTVYLQKLLHFRYLSLVRPSDDEDEYDKEKFTDMFLENFTFLITSKIAEVPQHWFQKFCVVKIVWYMLMILNCFLFKCIEYGYVIFF